MFGPRPRKIELTPTQRQILERLTRRHTGEQREIRRAKIILLAASGLGNREIGRQIGMHRDSVCTWRKRWTTAQGLLALVEQEESEEDLAKLIKKILQDEPRSGAPPTFTAEQLCQLMALACESPEASGRPITHWTSRELADEAIKRDIVPSISARTVGRFFRGVGNQATSHSVLAEPFP